MIKNKTVSKLKLRFLYFFLLSVMQLPGLPNVLNAQEQINAVIPGDFADPSIIRSGSQYYAVGTSSEWAPHFPVFQSGNLLDWKQTGYIFDKAPEWTSGSFWAPEFYYHNNTYFLYYTARRKKDKVSYIGVATSRYPDKGFKDHGVIIEHGKEAIDAFVFNDNGQLYITFKAYGLDKRPIEILGSKLAPDGLSLQGELFSMLKDDKGIGLEGQSILKKDDYYYLFYSAGNCCGINCDYNLRMGRSKTLKGPYEDYNHNPVLQENAGWKCSGHGSFVLSPQGKYFYLYHAYNKQSGVFAGRQGLLAELIWNGKNNWPEFNVPTSRKINSDLTDLFDGNTADTRWQWDFRNSSPVVKQHNGNLHLSGTIHQGNYTGIAYTVRPADVNFEAATTVVNHNEALKGLVYYGDANASLGIGVIRDSVQVWRVKDSTRTVLASAALQNGLPADLKIKLNPDGSCSFLYKQTQQAWQELNAGKELSAGFLPQWDRSPRIGLHYKGEPTLEAVFSKFELKYN